MNEIYENELNPESLDFNESRGLGYSTKNKKSPSAARLAFNQSNQSNWQSKPIVNLSELIGQSDYGESVYDEQIQNIDQLNDIEDTRADIQPFTHKAAIGLGTFVAKTATATAGGIGNIFYGTASAIADGRLRSFYDNALMNGLQSVNEDIDGALKIYQSDSERNGDFWDQTLGSSHF